MIKVDLRQRMQEAEAAISGLNEKHAADIVARLLLPAFDWSQTQEGFDFWHEVQSRLNRIGRHGSQYHDPYACVVRFEDRGCPRVSASRDDREANPRSTYGEDTRRGELSDDLGESPDW